MLLRFYLDPESGDPHCFEHGVREDEVEAALVFSLEDRPGADDSRVAIGCGSGGRLLRVIYVPDPGGTSAFVLTAYPLAGRPLRAFRRRMRRRPR